MREQILDELNKLWYDYLINEKMKVILKIKILWKWLKEIYEIFDFKTTNWEHYYVKRTFDRFLKKVFDIKEELNYKDELKNSDRLNEKQKKLVDDFLKNEQNNFNFEIKKYFTLEDVYFWFINQWDYNEENAETLLIPKSLIKKETNLIYY